MKIEGLEINNLEAIANEPYTALLAINRQAIIELFDQCKEWQDEQGIKQDYRLEITMSCGYSKKIASHDDIPFEDLPCPCGGAGRYLIRYGKE